MLSLTDALANLSNLPLISNMLSGGFFTVAVKNNIWAFIWFVVAYAIVFIMLPAKILNLRLCDGNFLDNAMICVTVSQVTLTCLVFVLSFMKMYNTLTLVLALILTILFYYKFKYRISYREKLRKLIIQVSDVVDGQLKISLIVRNFINKRINNASNAIKRFIRFYFDKNVAYHIIGTLCILVLAIRRGYFAITSESFPTSDVSVHTSWINFLDAGYVFSDGIYPFAMHNVVSSFAKLTFIDVVTVMRFIGPLNAIFMGILLMVFITRIFKSPAASVITGLVYCVSSFGTGAVVDRIFFSLPQEFGMLYIIPTAYFMIKFLEEERTIDGITFALAASMTVAGHFYDAIFAVPLCFCLAIPYIPRLFKKGILIKMVLSVVLAAVISLGPMMVGLMMGYRWQGSLDWAVSMMESGGSDESDDKSQTAQSSEDKSSDQKEAEQNKESIVEKSVNSFGWLAKDYTDYWGQVVLWCAGISLLMGIGAMIFMKEKMVGRVAVGLALNMAMFNYVLMYPTYYGLPSLIGSDRAVNYLIYLGAPLIGVPFGLFWNFFEKKLRGFRWVGSVAIVTATACLIFFTGATFTSSAYFRLTYSSVTEQYYKIKNTHRKDTWTIVSTVDELSLTRNKGWHYELWEFIFSMEQYEPTRVVQIPTEYVYVVVEKRPLKYADTTYLGQPLDIYGRISKASAKELLSERTIRTSRKSDYYSKYSIRERIMSKAYFWAEKYMQYFPDQMSVYYEDRDVTIYEIKQNMYALNNFAIDYGYNTQTLEQWLEEHPEAIGQEVPQTVVSDSDLAAPEDTQTEQTATP